MVGRMLQGVIGFKQQTNRSGGGTTIRIRGTKFWEVMTRW